ncbi:hypothetical protein AC578_4517 [Pseudocercospora eumusae]|uniref:Uncharacterized protein n=1 Tax=Pseudocercospora eumusae TaxID=321146 RepID=A0A139GWB0_9PEZI|nr:hypothetical protein AC578_4517 [Pseudocercospora eumusae]
MTAKSLISKLLRSPLIFDSKQSQTEQSDIHRATTSSHLADMDTKTLCECLEDLPRELYDEIYNLSFAPPSKDTIISIDDSYKPPPVSQISHATRKSFQAAYKQCIFVGEIEPVSSWVNSLEDAVRYQNVVCWHDEADSSRAPRKCALTATCLLESSLAWTVVHNVIITNSRDTMNELLKIGDVGVHSGSLRKDWFSRDRSGVLKVYAKWDKEQDEWAWVSFPWISLELKYGFR